MQSGEICPICPVCNRQITTVILGDHHELFECKYFLKSDEASLAGLELVTASIRAGLHTIDSPDHRQLRETLAHIVGANVTHLVLECEAKHQRSSFMAIWGPTWLAQALKNYNSQSAGYAGLSLSQYLDMVKP